MHKTAIRIDDELAAEAREILGTRTLTDTVNAALREVVDRQRRELFVSHLTDADAFDFDAIEDAWR
ncbi:MAG: type II toxin-antitoxin system VapB family antitoxin [Actinobacteria bacterium]|nr:type II toxin-antitoxin system VapB family antitoxin [Actinomycetota bacterium]